jgi:ArsR family transcriptional regulator, arsenate/arsenite/antimonite-responsive transcriptional repressor
MGDIFDVLADSTRRELLAALLSARISAMPRGELSVSELVERLELSQPTVSKHLQKLREQAFVSVRTDGQHHYYRLETAPLRDLESWVADFLATEESADSASSPLFAAWSGVDVGETLGRRLAEGTHQARVVVTEKVVAKLPKLRKGKGDSHDIDSE